MLSYGRNLLQQNILATQSIEETLKRLRDERDEADRLYNTALTALDRAIQQLPALPGPPPPYDEHQITPLNSRWNVLPPDPPGTGTGLRARWQAAVWRIIGPLFQRQQEFNSAIVDHINRNVRHHRETEQALAELIGAVRQQLEGFSAFQTRLVVYLQQITLYIDTRDRDVAGIRLPLAAEIGRLAAEMPAAISGVAAEMAAAISAVADELHKRWESIGILQQATMAMKRELERMAAGGGIASDANAVVPVQAAEQFSGIAGLDAFKYVGFEDRYRGSREAVREKLAAYVPLFEGASQVLDVGCGRGEFLEMLAERGITARGIDLNRDMVAICRTDGLEAEEADALTYLQGLPDGSLGGIFSSQLIEHLEPPYLIRTLETMFHKLSPGGKLVLETINPASWAAFFSAYIRDITHAQPIHPETLSYLATASGFSNVTIRYSAPFAEPEKLQIAPPDPAPSDHPALARAIDTYNANMEKLNNLLFAYRDYAVIAERIR